MRRSLLVLLVTSALVLGACSDDDDGSADTTEADSTATVSPSGEVDPEALTEVLREAIVGDSGETYDPEMEVTEASLDEVVIAPVAGSTTELTEDGAMDVCSAAATVIFREVPSAVVTIEDVDGVPLVTTAGAGGVCASAEEKAEAGE
jgi:hypothetical protein